MKELTLRIPMEVLASAKIPRNQLEPELRRRLAAALFSDGVIGGAAACGLAGMGKVEFQFWLGEHGVTQPLDFSDIEQELEELDRWLENA